MNHLSKLHFWDWFKRHQSEYLDIKNKSKKEVEYLRRELNAHLRAYFKFFDFMLLVDKEKKGSLIISVNGKSEHFKKVDAMVEKAPQIPGWTFQALLQPRWDDVFLDEFMNQTGFDPREFFYSVKNANHSHIIIYHPLVTEDNYYDMKLVADSLVYNMIGERVYGTEIHRVAVANLSTADPRDIENVQELPARLGLQHSNMVVDSKGNILF